jgi:drug/metabolite transporter (DMT)-like permease
MFTNRTKAHFAALTANLIFGANYSIVKYITPGAIKPLGLNVIRVLVSLVMFWGLLLFKPSSPAVSKKDIGRFILCAATGIAINQMLFIKGLSLTTSIHASLLSLGTPVFITIIAAWLLKEQLTIIKIAGLFLGISGAVLLISGRESTGSGSDIFLGDSLVLINAISYGFFLVLSRPLMQKYSPLHVLRWVFTIGTFMIIPFGWNQFTQIAWSNITTYQWLALAFVAIGATFLAYVFNIYSLKYIKSTENGTYIYTQPLFATLIAIIFIGETITPVKIISAVLISAGVYLVNRVAKTS